MIIVDTSVWIDHIRAPLDDLFDLITSDRALQHPFVIGEIALGSIASRDNVLRILSSLPQVRPMDTGQVVDFIVQNQLPATGIGFVDAHLLASTEAADAQLWTRDKRLAAQAERLGLLAKLP